jgi:hypothetical protein
LRNGTEDRAQLRSVCDWFADQRESRDLTRARRLLQS